MSEVIATIKKATSHTDFADIASKTIGHNITVQTAAAKKKLIYADWIASGRLYQPIEDAITHTFGPLVGNTHSESSLTGESMTHAYKIAHAIIRKHVHANENDALLTFSSGMTGVLAKLQRILGLHIPEKAKPYYSVPQEEKPVVFITHMEHHSNQTSWLECEVDVVVIPPGDNLLIAPAHLEMELQKYSNRKTKIGSFSACSNVTGIITPYHELAKIMHRHGGICFVDFAASAPYVDMNMHPADPDAALDAIFFSPHKFLGGPGSTGVLVFNKSLYTNRIPDQPGGGTVTWTNPWGEHHYYEDVETREDGGTPAFLQTIKAALAIKLKEQMTTEAIQEKEELLIDRAVKGLSKIPTLHIMGDLESKRIGVLSFYVEGLHYNLLVRVLSDHFGIQVRGGCSCAGTYGHYLLRVTKEQSRQITEKIDSGDLSEKPGWVRLSLHPIMTESEVDYIVDAIEQIVQQPTHWSSFYEYSVKANEFYPIESKIDAKAEMEKAFEL
ncbi:MAG: aminotransferase class V-fold PLP-dependent enzyme [Cyclobacteriaceae bacterium]|nr:aminotransferase class V-fold PLP-dependent enzyme [Cyclobacteriaceae bacterium]